MNYDNKITVTKEDGTVVECDVIVSFECTDTGKNYIVYTDGELDEDGNTKLYASTYDDSEEIPRLLEIETEEEWQMVDEILDQMIADAYAEEESEN